MTCVCGSPVYGVPVTKEEFDDLCDDCMHEAYRQTVLDHIAVYWDAIWYHDSGESYPLMPEVFVEILYYLEMLSPTLASDEE